MTKTAAAKRFAEKYGTYDHGHGTYTLLLSSTGPGGSVYRDRYEKAVERRQQESAQHAADLRVVMALLGVEEQYEDTVEERVTRYSAYSSHVEEVVVKSGAQKFAEDLRAAQSAINGEAALKRLRKAVKTTQKEQSK
jgi:hypothetical protein